MAALLALPAVLAGCGGGGSGGGSGGGATTAPQAAATTAAAATEAATTTTAAAKETAAETTQKQTEKATAAEEKKADTPASGAKSYEGISYGGTDDGMEWRLKTDPIHMTMFIDGSVNDWVGWGNEPISEEITRRTGVTVDVKKASTTEHEELNAMMASGTLPDFIKCWEPTLRATLWKQGFLQPLNKLADQYCPNMYSIVPKDMDKFYTESDGNWYFVAGYYSDVDRLANMPGVQSTITGSTINMPAYEKLGKPSMATLDEYKEVLLRVKDEMGAEFPYIIYEQSHGSPNDGARNMAQLFSRIMGGDPVKAIGSDGKVHLNFRDETYKQAILYINDLYRSGLINREMFTMTTSELTDPLFKNQQVFSFWGQPWWSYQFDSTAEGPYQAVDVPKVPGIKPQWPSCLTGIGGPEAAITTNCKDPERAILYYEFLLSDEGQLLTYHGREGIDYTWVDGMPKNSAEKQAMWDTSFQKMQSDMGILNYNTAWFATNWADQLYYYWLNKDLEAYGTDTIINNQYARNERDSALLVVETDSNAAVIEKQVNELWKAQYAKMVLAESESECLAALDELISKAETLGLKELEAEYTAIHAKWQALTK